MSGYYIRGVNAINVDKPLKFPPVSPEEQTKIDACCKCKKSACKTGHCELFPSNRRKKKCQ